MFRASIIAFATLAFLRAATATDYCTLKNDMKNFHAYAKPPTCQTMGEGYYSFVLSLTDTCVPSFEGGFDGCVDGNAIAIYDNTCKKVGHYSLGDDLPNDCGIPYAINEPWVPYQVSIQEIDKSIGGGYFKFAYANGLYTIGNNGCICSGISGSSLQAHTVCGCAFPIHGEPTKIKGRSPALESY